MKKEDIRKTKIHIHSRKKEVLDKLNSLGINVPIANYNTDSNYFYITSYDEIWPYSVDNLQYKFDRLEDREITVEDLLGKEMKTYQVTEEFIKEAHTAACSGWKSKLEKQFPEVFPKPYKLGDVFVDTYDSTNEVTLIKMGGKLLALCTGGRYTNEVWSVPSIPITPASFKNITETEVNAVLGSQGIKGFKLKQ